MAARAMAAAGLKIMDAGVKAPPPMGLEMQVDGWPMPALLVEGTALASLLCMAPRYGIMDMPPNPGAMGMDDMGMDMDMDMGRREPEMAAAACDIMLGMMPSSRGDLVLCANALMGARSCTCRSTDFLSVRSWVGKGREFWRNEGSDVEFLTGLTLLLRLFFLREWLRPPGFDVPPRDTGGSHAWRGGS